jgi:glycosyltransferase involved in cell wall biosynthesis
LNGRKIGTRNLFAGNITRQPVFAGGEIPFRVSGDLTATDDVMMNTFWIGCYPGLTEAALDYVARSFHEFCLPFRSGERPVAKPATVPESERLPTNLSIVIPAYNEGHHLDAVIRRLQATLRRSEPSFEIVLVNNGSTDETPSIVRALAHEFPEVRVVDVFPNQGFGNGVLAGMAQARGEILGWMHADEQAKPEYLLEIYHAMKAQGLDLGKAVRIHRHEPFWRIVQSRIYNILFRWMFNLPYRDINGTPKLLSRSFYERARLNSKEWFLDPEVMLKAARMGGKIGEVEIIWNARKGGKSKVHLGTMFHFLKRMVRYRYRKDL